MRQSLLWKNGQSGSKRETHVQKFSHNVVNKAPNQQRYSLTSIVDGAKVLNMVWPWGAGEENKTWKGKEVPGSGKQVVGVSGHGVWELQGVSVSKT